MSEIESFEQIVYGVWSLKILWSKRHKKWRKMDCDSQKQAYERAVKFSNEGAKVEIYKNNVLFSAF